MTRMAYPQGYGPAWINFRSYSQEDEILLRLIGEVVHIGPLPYGFTLIDIGGGDGRLTSRLLARNTLGQRLGFLTLLEPDSFLRDQADKTLGSTLRLLQVPYEVLPHPLCDLDLKNNVEGGLAVAVHSSYYFEESDLQRLRALRASGIQLLIIENQDDCWVSEIMWRMGNTTHPQFASDRRKQLIAALNDGSGNVQVERVSVPVRLRMPTETEVEDMINFFAFGWTGAPPRREVRKRLTQAFANLLAERSAFSYYLISSTSEHVSIS